MSFDVSSGAYQRFMGQYSEPLAVRFADLGGVGRGQRVLDVGCGPGALTAELVSRVGPELVSAVDPSGAFVAAARDRLPGADIRQSAAERLPFADGAFDITLAQLVVHFMADPVLGLSEMRRVTRPGGRLVVCEFSTITVAPADMLYRRYLLHVLPAIARRTARNPEAYEYLAESIVDWPAQRELAGLIKAAGWSAVKWRDLSLGAVAVHVARRT